jgi:2-hydroxy-6-oxonona-2,4-dienedioate hydrolase
MMNEQGLHFPPVTHHEVETASGSIHYVTAGTGEPLLLVHGGHGGWIHWLANIEALSQGHRVIALDMPGFGQSYVPQHRMQLPEYAVAVASFMERLALQRVNLVGFSFGSAVAASVAGQFPDAIGSLVLVSPPGIGRPSAESMALPERSSAEARQHGMRAGVANTLRELMLFNQERVDDALIDVMLEYVKRTQYVTRLVSRGSEMVTLLQKTSQPALVLIGAEDPFQKHELEERRKLVNQALGQNCARVVGKAGHWVQYDLPDVFNNALLDFLSAGTRQLPKRTVATSGFVPEQC